MRKARAAHPVGEDAPSALTPFGPGQWLSGCLGYTVAAISEGRSEARRSLAGLGGLITKAQWQTVHRSPFYQPLRRADFC